MKRLFTCCYVILFVILFVACSKHSNPAPVTPPMAKPVTQTLYFPAIGSGDWATVTPASLGWDETQLNALYPYLESEHTKAFIILKAGKIVSEKYFGTFTADSLWYWASAGKTLTGLLVGVAQQEGLLNINDKTSKYIGTGWTSAPPDKENLITIKNQLSMTSGLDDGVADNDCTLPSCLIYKADAATRWAYHTGVYTMLDSVIQVASKMSFSNYFQQKIRDKIGMNGAWYKIPHENNIYYSNARSMARFGLLMLNKGKWDQTTVLADTNYFNSMVNTSQKLNLSYGYLTWLNGKASSMVPTSQVVIPQDIIPNGPADLYAALGKNDQKVYVVPSQQLVVIRMGNSAGGFTLAVSDFDNTLWGKLKGVIKY